MDILTQAITEQRRDRSFRSQLLRRYLQRVENAKRKDPPSHLHRNLRTGRDQILEG